jgi:hypothetical protein
MAVGTLFTEDFLQRGLALSSAWSALDTNIVEHIEARFRAIVAAVAAPSTLNEAQTEERIIRPMLEVLGWQGLYTVQERLERRGRQNVPDYAYFADADAFARGDRAAGAEAKLLHAIAVGDAKAWLIDLDAQGSGAGGGETATAQTIRYLNRADAVSNRAVRWAILTNGRVWRLYWGGAKSQLDDYFETDLADILALPGTQTQLTAPRVPGESDEQRRARLFRTFVLVFRPQAFLPDARLQGATFHAFALEEGRRWEASVRDQLSKSVFDIVFPGFVRALVKADRSAPATLEPAYLAAVRDAALTALYRLLFLLYAEDRDLLPARDRAYDDYSLSKIRDDIAGRIDREDEFSGRAANYWHHVVNLFGVVNEGDETIGVPPYNGGLFAAAPAPLLENARLPDTAFAPLFDKLSRTAKDGRLVRINYRDLTVRELGAIYERLLEWEAKPNATAEAGITFVLNPFKRKGSGSYYTPDELVTLIIERAVDPLVDEKIEAFRSKLDALKSDRRPVAARLEDLAPLDPAERILDLKICDPAMGSGHFLVSLIDHLALKAFTNLQPECLIGSWAEDRYVSPLAARLATIRERIEQEATAHRWTVRRDQLVDRNLVKRMVLKRCVYGIDKNPMAVELAKLALWLHTFTAGAPLSFLDHHLRCGDSLFGERIRKVLDELARRGTLFISDAVRTAEATIAGMEKIEGLTDAEIAEVKASREAFAAVEDKTGPLSRFLDFWQAVKWLTLSQDEQRALQALLDGRFGDPVRVASGLDAPVPPDGGAAAHPSLFDDGSPRQASLDAAGTASQRDYAVIQELLRRAHALAAEERFLHWEVAFPGVWRNWQSSEPSGGFDAVIGNPPWDRMKMQEVEWFAARAPGIARQARAADRKRMITELNASGDPLAQAYVFASGRAETAMARARRSGEYPLLSRGDINIYSLFVERAQRLIKPTGIAGLLTPSGIASDLTASAFFKQVASVGRVLALFDFENRRGGNRAHFFPDVDSRFKFCALVVGGRSRASAAAECGFFLIDPPALTAPDRLFTMTPADFALVNPNTGTAPIFRTRRDAELTTAIYRRLPLLVDRSSGEERKAWPVEYLTMLHMTNDSHLFWTRERLEAERAYPGALGRWRKGEEEWLPLYEGKMVQAFDHRAANIIVNLANVHRPAQQEAVSDEQHADTSFFPEPQFWVRDRDVSPQLAWVLAYKSVSAPSNMRTVIAANIPSPAVGNSMAIIAPETDTKSQRAALGTRLLANINSFAFDFCARQKIQGQNLNWFIVEQLPVVPPAAYEQSVGVSSYGALVDDHVLHLTYTANDIEAFARDMGYEGAPFRWEEDERRHIRARLDALYFHLYGVTDEADIRYILSTFPIVERKDREAHEGVYLTAELIIWYFRVLAAGDATSLAPEAAILRGARRAA